MYIAIFRHKLNLNLFNFSCNVYIIVDLVHLETGLSRYCLHLTTILYAYPIGLSAIFNLSTVTEFRKV
jgi:hypothetical protein